MSLYNNPFHKAAASLLQAGYHPLPLPYGEKSPPPQGFTGADAFDVTSAQVEKWLRGGERLNVAVRLPGTMIGLDVNNLDGNRGGDELAQLQWALGDLSPTFVSSDRGWGPSGTGFFRVPNGMIFPRSLSPSIEIIQRSHGHVVVSPSVDASGEPTVWYGPDGSPQDDPPAENELTMLPVGWVKYLAHPKRGITKRGAKGSNPNGSPASPTMLEICLPAVPKWFDREARAAQAVPLVAAYAEVEAVADPAAAAQMLEALLHLADECVGSSTRSNPGEHGKYVRWWSLELLKLHRKILSSEASDNWARVAYIDHHFLLDMTNHHHGKRLLGEDLAANVQPLYALFRKAYFGPRSHHGDVIPIMCAHIAHYLDEFPGVHGGGRATLNAALVAYIARGRGKQVSSSRVSDESRDEEPAQKGQEGRETQKGTFVVRDRPKKTWQRR